MSSVTPPADAEHAQREAIRRLRGDPLAVGDALAASTGDYAGLVTRTIAFALDSLIVNGGALLVGVTVGLGVSLLHLPEEANVLVASVLGALWVLWTVAYFVFFWSSTGQTPGSRAMRIRVIDSHRRGPLKPRRAALRFISLCLAAIPLLAGIWMMLWDDRRRGLQDRVARTLVVYTPADA
jgi:uncharacterized RDD family membrane protein YckC